VVKLAEIETVENAFGEFANKLATWSAKWCQSLVEWILENSAKILEALAPWVKACQAAGLIPPRVVRHHAMRGHYVTLGRPAFFHRQN
jgi:hypothetical protein